MNEEINDWEDWKDSSTDGGSAIAVCGHISNWTDLQFVYSCFHDYLSFERRTDCLDWQELYEQEQCYWKEGGIDLIEPFFGGDT